MIDRITTVTAAATIFSLTSLDNVKSELGITDADSDLILDRYIRSESAKIEGYCNRIFAKETLSERFNLNCVVYPDAIQLSRFPVTTLTSVTEDDVLLAVTEYELDATSGLLYRVVDSYRTPWNCYNLVVVYQAGYTLPTSAPAAVEDACISMVKQRWFAKGRDPAIKTEDIDGILRQDFWVGPTGDGFPSEVEAMLAPYRSLARI